MWCFIILPRVEPERDKMHEHLLDNVRTNKIGLSGVVMMVVIHASCTSSSDCQHVKIATRILIR